MDDETKARLENLKEDVGINRKNTRDLFEDRNNIREDIVGIKKDVDELQRDLNNLADMIRNKNSENQKISDDVKGVKFAIKLFSGILGGLLALAGLGTYLYNIIIKG